MVVLPKEGEQNFPCDRSEEIFYFIFFENIYYLWEDLMKSIQKVIQSITIKNNVITTSKTIKNKAMSKQESFEMKNKLRT